MPWTICFTSSFMYFSSASASLFPSMSKSSERMVTNFGVSRSTMPLPTSSTPYGTGLLHFTSMDMVTPNTSSEDFVHIARSPSSSSMVAVSPPCTLWGKL